MAATAVETPAAPEREKEEAANPAEEVASAPKGPSLWSRLASKSVITKKVVMAIVALSLVGHGVGYWYTNIRADGIHAKLLHELPMGQFVVKPQNVGPNGISDAKFNLYISLLDEHADVARVRLKTHHFKVEQNIEELLRKSMSDDFNDPTLGELKRLLQETINETIGKRAIREVIITDFVAGYTKGEQKKPADGKPGEEKPDEEKSDDGPW